MLLSPMGFKIGEEDRDDKILCYLFFIWNVSTNEKNRVLACRNS
jgi:hypothetical protein